MACQAPWPKGLEFLTISLPYSRRNSQEPALSKRGSWLGLRGVKGPACAPTAKKWQGSEWTWPWGSSLASASLRDVGGLLRAETRRQTGPRLLPPLRQTKQQRAARLGVPSSRLLSAGAWLHCPRRARTAPWPAVQQTEGTLRLKSRQTRGACGHHQGPRAYPSSPPASPLLQTRRPSRPPSSVVPGGGWAPTERSARNDERIKPYTPTAQL